MGEKAALLAYLVITNITKFFFFPFYGFKTLKNKSIKFVKKFAGKSLQHFVCLHSTE